MSAENTTNGTAPEAAQPAIPHEDEGFRVYVGNLSYSTTEEQVREFLGKAGGELLSVALPLRFGKRPAGYAFASYKDEADAKKAVEQLNDQEFDGRKILLELARSKEEVAERRNAADEKRKEAKAAKAAEKAARAAEKGEAAPAQAEPAATESKPKKKRSARKPRRRLPEEGEEATGAEVEGEASDAVAPKPKGRARKPKEARIDAAEGEGEGGVAATTEKKKRERKPRAPRLELTGEQSQNTIFVANLPFNVDDDALAAIFTNLSITVKSAKVIHGVRRGKPGSRPFRASKGFGFVEVEDPAQQKEAVEKVEGSLVGDRKITAKIANEMKPIEREQAAEATEQATEA
ncbi:hypothetical protein JCM24511_03602 [Saitozyma sp. JCM 24511]|nr:hypothetical protein JCM24511_03602 [Saitozyma sp. JCM 24511]